MRNGGMNMENIENRKGKLPEWVSELWKMMKAFFVRYKGVENVSGVPLDVKRSQRILEVFGFGMSLLGLLFSFMLRATNMLIEHQMIVLGVIVFIMYKGERLIDQFLYNYENLKRPEINKLFDENIIAYSAEVLSRTTGRVFKYNEKSKISALMSNEKLINCCKRYIKTLWWYQISHIFDFYKLISTLVMLVVVFVTNTEIPNAIFIPFVILFSIVAFLVTAYQNYHKHETWKKERVYRDEQDVIYGDIARVKPIVDSDIPMRIEKFRVCMSNSRGIQKSTNQKLNKAAIINASFELIFQVGIIVFYVFNIKFENVTVASIAVITANLTILMTALKRISELIKVLSNNLENINNLNAEIEDMKAIMDVYENEKTLSENNKKINKVELEPFVIQYEKKDENDEHEIPFTLQSDRKICIEQGEVAVFIGPSGTGKSTVMKLLTDQVRLGKSIQVPHTRRYLCFDETLNFGSQNIYDEFFAGCGIHLKKAFDIFESLHLSQELKFSLSNMEDWMKKNFYSSSMSHGQKQRMILAKILYHLDDTIDILVLDEPTSGLDESADEGMDAQKLLEYVISYANSDRKRIVILSTHQSFDGCRNSLEAVGYKFKIFEFGNGKISEIVGA